MIILETTGTIFGTIFETIIGETFWVNFWTIFRIVFGYTFQNYFNYAIFRIQVLAFILFSFEFKMSLAILCVVIFCFVFQGWAKVTNNLPGRRARFSQRNWFVSKTSWHWIVCQSSQVRKFYWIGRKCSTSKHSPIRRW